MSPVIPLHSPLMSCLTLLSTFEWRIDEWRISAAQEICTVYNHVIAVSCTPGRLTEVFECLFDLLSGQVEPGVRCDEGSVQPVIVVVAVDGVSPQPVHRQLLLQKTDDLKLWQVSTVAHIWTAERRREEHGTQYSSANQRQRHKWKLICVKIQYSYEHTLYLITVLSVLM